MPLEDRSYLESSLRNDSRHEFALDAARDCRLEVNRVMRRFDARRLRKLRLGGEPALTVKLRLEPCVRVAVTDTSSDPRGRALRIRC